MRRERPLMRLKVIGCEALLRETCRFAARSEHVIDLEFFDFGLHNDPAAMRVDVQRRIGASEGEAYDAIILVAGLCGNGSAGLTAGGIPLVLPRADDCIVLLLGSRESYDSDHGANPGTYYLTPGFLERANQNDDGIGQEARRRIHLHYVERYGQDNADYLMSVLHSWQGNYSRACFIDSGAASPRRLAQFREQARAIAGPYGWQYDELSADTRMLRDLFDGHWTEEDFLVVPPGHRIEPSNDSRVLTIA